MSAAVAPRTYGSLAHVGDGWVLGGLEPHVAIKLKAVFPQIPKESAGPFRFRDTPDRCADLAWFEIRYPLSMSAEDRRRLARGAARHQEITAEIERIKVAEYKPRLFVGLREGQAVRPHQALAVEILARVGGLLVGDEVGEGKTYTGGAACLLPGALPAVVVCMPHLKAQWQAKLEAFTNLRVAVVSRTTPYQLPEHDVRVMSYTQLSGWADTFEMSPPGLVIFDEMQELRTGERSGKGAAALRLVSGARLRLGLTATPVYNYGDEIWEVMRYLRPEVLGSREEFLREYCSALGNGRHRVRDPQALGAYLRDVNAFIRKDKDRPARPNVIVRQVPHDPGELRNIEEVARALAERATTGTFVERGEAMRELDMRVRHATGLAKARSVARAVRVLVGAGEPVVLFGWHRDVYDVWLEELADLRPALYTGTESPAAKARSVDRFLSGDTDVLIMSLRSGAGVDGLQYRASTAVIGELDWSPGVHHQNIGRLDREGQRCYPDPVTAIYLVAEDGADPPMMEVLGLKASQAAQIVNPALGVQAAANDDSRLRTLVDRYLKRERGD